MKRYAVIALLVTSSTVYDEPAFALLIDDFTEGELTVVGTHPSPDIRDEMLSAGSQVSFTQRIPAPYSAYERYVQIQVGDQPMQMPVVDISRDGLRIRTERYADARVAWDLRDTTSNLLTHGRHLLVDFDTHMFTPTESASITIVANKEFDVLQWTVPFPLDTYQLAFTFPEDMETYVPDTLTNLSLRFEGLTPADFNTMNLWIRGVHVVPEPTTVQSSFWILLGFTIWWRSGRSRLAPGNRASRLLAECHSDRLHYLH
jgi:hypothetical protein